MASKKIKQNIQNKVEDIVHRIVYYELYSLCFHAHHMNYEIIFCPKLFFQLFRSFIRLPQKHFGV